VFEEFLYKFRRFFRFKVIPEETRSENPHLKKLRMLVNSIGKAKMFARQTNLSEGMDV